MEAPSENQPPQKPIAVGLQSHTSELPKPLPWSLEAVISKLENAPTEGSSSPIPFFHLVERLKTEKREGWRRFDIHHGESIADHMYRMSIITMLAPPSLSSRIDIPRCTKMALVHDMAESLVGDITPMDKVPKAEKSRREEQTIDYMCTKLLGKVYGGVAGSDIKSVWREYEDSKTLESLYVHDVDKIELLLQMVEYEKAHNAKLNLGEFARVAEKLHLEEMKGWAREILEEQKAFWKSRNITPPLPEISEKLKEQQDQYYDKVKETA